MIIAVDAAGLVALEDAGNFRAFAIRLAAGGVAEAALSRIARRDGAHWWVAQDALCALAPLGGDADWRARLAGMVGFARQHGWVDEAGAIRAHVEAAG